MSLETLQALWDSRRNLVPNPPLIETLADIRRKHLPGAGIARKLEIYLTKPESISHHLIDSVAFTESVRYKGKNILLVALEIESEEPHKHLASHIQNIVEPIDIFLHYPYSKHSLSKAMVSDSYAAKVPYSLDTPRQFQRFGDEVRFHYCDLRLDWIGEDPELIKQRLQLLGSYSEYLLNQDESSFFRNLQKNRIELKDFLQLDQSLVRLEGKIRKSYDATEEDMRDMILASYDRHTQECRMRLDLLREEILKQAVVPVYLYIEFLGELNSLYQNLNAFYVLLRMFRHFHKVKDIHSEDAVNCVIILPKQVVSILQRMMPSLKAGRDTMDNWFTKFSSRL